MGLPIVCLAAGLFWILSSRPARASDVDVKIVDGRAIVDDADPQFMGAEIRAPQFCPYDTNWLSFEAYREKSIHLYLYDRANARITEILPNRGGPSGRISGGGGDIQNTDFDWRPKADGGGRWYVFSSRATGSFDLWLGEATSGRLIHIPAKDEAKNERGAKWSPDGELLAYWSDATFQGDIYLLKYVRDLFSADTTKRLDPPTWLVKDPGLDYEIRWYPGPKAGYLAYTHHDLESQQSRRVEIRVCDILDRRIDTIQNVAPNTYMQSASWNPTGRPELAFYQADEFPGRDTSLRWAVGVVRIKVTNPDKGTLEMRVRRPVNRVAGEIERSVFPSYDLRFGPVWTPDGGYLALARDFQDTVLDLRSPLWLYELRSWELGETPQSTRSFAPEYKFPRDQTISRDQIAFVFSQGSSRKLLTGRLAGNDFLIPKPVATWPLLNDERRKRYDWIYNPDTRPGLLTKIGHWVTGPVFKPNFGLNSRIVVATAIVAAIALWPPPPPPNPTESWNPPGFGN